MNKLLLLGWTVLFLTSCSNHVDFGEQYKKIVYIVKSDNKVYLRQHKITGTEQIGDIALYCGGSDDLKEDVTVTLMKDEESMDAYNNKTFDASNQHEKLVVLPEKYYKIPSYDVVIKAGTEYTKIPITLQTNELDPDVCYAIPLSIKEVSRYEINDKLKTVFYQLELVNDFSGNYLGTLKNIQGKDTIFTAKDKELKAIEENKVRTVIYNLNADHENLETNFMVLTISADNKVTINPWKNAKIRDLGNSVYDPVKKTFTLHYECRDNADNLIKIEEDLVDSDAVVDDEEEK